MTSPHRAGVPAAPPARSHLPSSSRTNRAASNRPPIPLAKPSAPLPRPSANRASSGTYGGATLLANGYTSKPIIGVRLDGGKFGGKTVAAIPDTDHGKLDGDTRWDHAVGPLQFLPSTWARWGADGSGDGVASPDQIDDAALAAALYLCASGPMTDTAGWRAAVFSYNQSNAYVNEVADIANRYAAEVSGLS